jgi:hypothetical protein
MLPLVPHRVQPHLHLLHCCPSQLISGSVPTCSTTGQNLFNFSILPLLVAQRASATSLEPSLNAVKMEDVAASAPCDRKAGMIFITCWICGVIYAGLVEVIAADSACVRTDGPGPHSHCVPLLDFETGLCTRVQFHRRALVLGRSRCSCYVRHLAILSCKSAAGKTGCLAETISIERRIDDTKMRRSMHRSAAVNYISGFWRPNVF